MTTSDALINEIDAMASRVRRRPDVESMRYSPSPTGAGSITTRGALRQARANGKSDGFFWPVSSEIEPGYINVFECHGKGTPRVAMNESARIRSDTVVRLPIAATRRIAGRCVEELT
jgi:hypothetical protein